MRLAEHHARRDAVGRECPRGPSARRHVTHERVDAALGDRRTTGAGAHPRGRRPSSCRRSLPPAAFEHARDRVARAEQEPAQVHRDGAVEHARGRRRAHRCRCRIAASSHVSRVGVQQVERRRTRATAAAISVGRRSRRWRCRTRPPRPDRRRRGCLRPPPRRCRPRGHPPRPDAPSSARRTAVAAPMPEPPPATTTTLSLSPRTDLRVIGFRSTGEARRVPTPRSRPSTAPRPRGRPGAARGTARTTTRAPPAARPGPDARRGSSASRGRSRAGRCRVVRRRCWSACGNTDSSRLADAVDGMTPSPARISTPPISTSSVARYAICHRRR